jgi:hypothetical protein
MLYAFILGKYQGTVEFEEQPLHCGTEVVETNIPLGYSERPNIFGSRTPLPSIDQHINKEMGYYLSNL